MHTAFLLLLGKIAPLYLLVAVGYVLGHRLNVRKESMAALLLYGVIPFIVFYSVLTVPRTFQFLSIPFLFFVVCSTVCLLTLWLSSRIWNDATARIVAFAAGAGNAGYFGIPVALAIFGEQVAVPAVLAMLGIILYDHTVGFMVTAQGEYSLRASLRKLIGLPSLWACLAAIALRGLNLEFLVLGQSDLLASMRGASAVLGMMLVGVALGNSARFVIDWGVVGLTFAGRFLLWPLCMAGLVYVDRRFLGVYPLYLEQLFLVFSVLPLAVNTVAYATVLHIQPEKAATAVLFSTLMAALTIPLMAALCNAI